MRRPLTLKDLARVIDYAVLKPYVTKEDIIRACNESILYNFSALCVNPFYVPVAYKLLRNSPVKICAVISFPFGATSFDAKLFEVNKAIEDGADEIDVMMNVSALKNGEYEYVKEEISSIAKLCKSYSILLKVIIECCYLSDSEKEVACEIVKEAGADFIKTSTGYGEGGATVHDIKLIRRVVGNKLGIKASGGIRTLQDAIKMLEAGADRIGTSNAVGIIEEFKESGQRIYA